MSYTNVYPSRINWENEPNISTPINATNLNKTDYALYSIDQTLAGWDTTKANQSDLLLCVKSIDYDTTTGVFVFTWQNGTTKTVDLNIEKIPVTFSMDANGVITMTTADGTQYTADVGALIKTYTFTDSSTIDFTVTTDASGNKTIVADIVDGSITGTKLQPNYLADCQTAETNASNSATAAAGSKGDAEAWAVGTRGGVPVPSTDPAYNNNSYYWSQHGASNSLAGLTDVDITNAQDGQTILYDVSASKWKNGDAVGGGSTIEVTTSESSLYNKTVTITDGTTTISNTFDNSGKATFKGVTLTGTLTISASDGTSTSTKYITVPYFGNYSAVLSFFTATITATFPSNHGATCTCDGQTSSSSPHSFTVNAAGTYNVVCTLDGISKTESVTITTDGQTVSKTFEYGTINLTYESDFQGATITCTQGGTTITKTAPSGGSTMAFYPPTTGTWNISSTVGGNQYDTSATISSLSTPVSASLEAIPNGKTKTPTDDIQTWLKCAGITDKSYTLLSEVLADEETYINLLSDSNACDYMARSTAWALSEGLVPIMTDNTHPSGEAFGSSKYSDTYDYYKAFDGVNTVDAFWSANSQTQGAYLGYEFTSPVVVSKVVMTNRMGTDVANQTPSNFTIQGYDTEWHDIGTFTNSDYSQGAETSYTLLNTTAYTKYRLYVNEVSGTHQTSSIGALQFYSADITTNVDAMRLLGMYDYACYVLRANNTWNTAINNSSYASYIPASPTGQTDIIHSAPSDTIYYMDNGTQTTLCTTDANGVGTVDWSDLPTGDITLYSSVAKDPDDLTDDYGKSIKVTKNKTEAWLMPDDGVLYWYGYESSDLENCTSANGWSWSGFTTNTPSHQTNYIECSLTSKAFCYVAKKDKVSSGTVIKSVVEGVTAYNNIYGFVMNTTSKTITSSTISYENITSNSLSLVSKTTSAETYVGVGVDCGATASRKIKIHAIMLE